MNNIAKKSGRVEKEDGNYINWADYLVNTTDSFGFQVAEQTKNVADISSQYPSSPERHRFYINGTRILLQYTTDSKFEDASDSYILKPAGGDVLRFQTAERFRYNVGYVISPSSAFLINQALSGDDKVVIGYGEPDLENDMTDANGWFWEFDSTHSTTQCYLRTYRDGTEVSSKLVSLDKAYTIWQRIEDRINWYNAGNRECRQTYTNDGEQINKVVGKTSVDDAKGPSRANFPYTFAVKADAGTTGLELDTGSIGIKIFGSIEPIFRVKEAIASATHSGGGSWEPLFALRKDPNNQNVFMNLSDIEISEVSADDDVEILAISVDPSLTDAATWTVPVYHSETNSVLQETTSVTTFPNSVGTEVTSATNPGGFQVGFATYFTAGTGTANRRSTSARGVRKRAFDNGDYIVVLAKTSTSMTITLNYETEQQW